MYLDLFTQNEYIELNNSAFLNDCSDSNKMNPTELKDFLQGNGIEKYQYMDLGACEEPTEPKDIERFKAIHTLLRIIGIDLKFLEDDKGGKFLALDVNNYLCQLIYRHVNRLAGVKKELYEFHTCETNIYFNNYAFINYDNDKYLMDPKESQTFLESLGNGDFTICHCDPKDIDKFKALNTVLNLFGLSLYFRVLQYENGKQTIDLINNFDVMQTIKEYLNSIIKSQEEQNSRPLHAHTGA